jgi:hypothetical protein
MMLNKNNLILNEYSDDYFIVGSSHTKVKNKFAEKYKKEDEYLITDNVHGKVLVDGPEILYKINKDGFRSQHFQNFNKDKKNTINKVFVQWRHFSYCILKLFTIKCTHGE